MKAERMMKWRVRRQSKCFSSEENDDVRRSLEILDNVLAEFDDPDLFSAPGDGGDSILNGDKEGNPIPHAHQQKEKWEDENGNKLQQRKPSPTHLTGRITPELQSLDRSTDGSTSQQFSSLDESRRCSAPPVPKRSPGTRLSHRDRPLLSQEDQDEREDEVALTCGRNLAAQNNEQQGRSSKGNGVLSVPAPTTSSPVGDSLQISNQERRREITTEDFSLEFYLARDEDDGDDDVFVTPPRRVGVRWRNSSCRICGGRLDHSTPSHAALCDTPKPPMNRKRLSEDQIRRKRLEVKFAKVKLLLRTNQITGLDNPPPSFKPLLPPLPRLPDKSLRDGVVNNNAATIAVTGTVNRDPQESDDAKNARDRSPREVGVKHTWGSDELERINVKNGLPPRDAKCVRKGSQQRSNRVCEDHAKSCETLADQKQLSPSDVLCKNCLNKGWSFRSPESTYNETSPLKRPPLDLSYSLEDDLSPGIKEISACSGVDALSDSVLSSPKSSTATHLSTFSHSASSLGDGSSQSDLDFSMSLDSGKVPMTSIKSLTLPTDMKLGPSPFYCAMESEDADGTDARLDINGLEAMRSSSAPPPPQDKGHWKRDKTGVSRKEKQAKSDGGNDNRHTGEDDAAAEDKPKKRSVWKSILRRK